MPTTLIPDRSDPALAFALLQQTRHHGDLVAILRGAGRLDRIARLATAFAPGGEHGVEVLVLPPVDVLPYDLVPPSSHAVSRRVAALTRLAEPATLPRLLLTSATASLQRVRPPRCGGRPNCRSGKVNSSIGMRCARRWRSVPIIGTRTSTSPARPLCAAR